jgi:serine/threonine protein kinase
MEYINKTIGKYTITRKIGEGGMASVYEGIHEKLGTKVAIKILSPILARNPQLRQRFENEANFMASLNHPHITRVLDIEEQDETLAIVMELLEGEDLDDRVKRAGPLSNAEVKVIFTQVLNAFEYAHSKGIVHRDIKPANIFIDKNNQVKILDFGIAKIFGTGNEMTQTGTQMGTPVYMSPEQVKGEKSIDHRSDIYALGITLYFILTGKAPYESAEESSFEIFTKIVNEPIPHISNNSFYDDIIQKAVSKDRNERYQTVDEFTNTLNGYEVCEVKTIFDLNSDSNQVKETIENKVEPTQNTIVDQSKTDSSLNQKNKLVIFISYIPLLLLLGFSAAYFIILENYTYFYFSYEFNEDGFGWVYYESMKEENSNIGIVTSIYVLLSSLLWLFLYTKFKMKIHYILRIIKIIFSSVVGVWALLKAMYLLNYSTTQEELFVWIPFIMFELFFAILLIVKCIKKSL